MNKTLASANTDNVVKTLPEFINLDRWEDSGYIWSGQITASSFPRLADMIAEGYQNDTINITCNLTKQGQLLTLTMDFSGAVWVICQRCLQPLDVDITHQSTLILLQYENQESLVDESDDYILLNELLNTQSESQLGEQQGERLLPLRRLVEDELLLEVPLSAKHDDCEMAVQQVGEIIEQESDNPFAVLESLKGKL